MDALNVMSPGDSRQETETSGGAKNAFRILYSILCLEVLFAIPFGAVYLVNRSTAHAIVAIGVTLVLIIVAWRLRLQILSGVDRVVRRLPLNSKHWLLAWFVIGLLLRIIWMWSFPISPRHDENEYFQKALLMAQGLPQTTLFPRTSLFMPPGWPLFLTPFFYVFGAHVWVTKLCGLLLFAATYWLSYRLSRTLCSERQARLASMLIAIWPSYVTICEVNAKENLLACLLVAILLAYVTTWGGTLGRRRSGGGKLLGFGSLLMAGILLGLATLTQPSFLLFPLVIVGIELLNRAQWRTIIARFAVICVGMVLAISPWTARNYLVTGRFVPISTNGGQLFYFQNNSLADFHHSDRGPEPLPADEILASSKGYQLGAKWIAAHPDRYAALFAERQLYFLGDDTSGLYSTLKFWLDPSGNTSPFGYRIAKLAVNVFWFAVWVLLLVGARRFFQATKWPMWFGVMILPFIYQILIDSAFEAETPHKVPYLTLIAISIGIVATTSSEDARMAAAKREETSKAAV